VKPVQKPEEKVTLCSSVSVSFYASKQEKEKQQPIDAQRRPVPKREARMREMRLRKILRVGESRAFFIKFWEKAATLLPPDYLLFWEIIHEFKSIYGAPGEHASCFLSLPSPSFIH